ncbi:MAG: transposase [Bacteroidales bacterium]|nr:transposase [Bacteroidales bacterium]
MFRKRKGGVKVHTLYDLDTQIPTFFHISPARIHDTTAMDTIPYEENSFYIFDRGYNDFKLLHNIESIVAYFAIRGKSNNDFKPMKRKRRFPPESGIQSDAIDYMAGQLTRKSILRRSEGSYTRKKRAERSLYSLQMLYLRAAAVCKYLINKHYQL